MPEDTKPDVNSNSASFTHALAVELNSDGDTNCKGRDERAQELRESIENTKQVFESTAYQASIPLFLSNASDGDKGNAQDEKDATGE